MDRVLDLGGREECIYGFLTLAELGMLCRACRITNPHVMAHLRQRRIKREPAIRDALERAIHGHRMPKFRCAFISVSLVLDYFESFVPASVRKNTSEHFRKRRETHLRAMAVFVLEIMKTRLVDPSYLEERLHAYLCEIRELWLRNIIRSTEDLLVVSPFLDRATIREKLRLMHLTSSWLNEWTDQALVEL